MRFFPLSAALLLAAGLIYISLFTYLISYISWQWFKFDVLQQTPALVLTLALAVSTLFASPLLPNCIRLSRRLGLCRYIDKISRKLF